MMLSTHAYSLSDLFRIVDKSLDKLHCTEDNSPIKAVLISADSLLPYSKPGPWHPHDAMYIFMQAV